MKKVLIKFIAQSQYAFNGSEKPYLASQTLPDWYRQTKHKYLKPETTLPVPSIRGCMPVLDLITAGYIIPLPQDIWVENNSNDDVKPIFRWPDGAAEQLITCQATMQYSNYPFDPAYGQTAHKLNQDWIVKTAKGWSCMFLHPAYRDDLPFKVLPGLVDTDKYPIAVSIVFFLKKGFEGLIPKGTPLVQVIPFKREKFVAKFSFDNGTYMSIWKKASTVFFDRYKKYFRTVKSFEIEKNKPEQVSKCPFANFFKK